MLPQVSSASRRVLVADEDVMVRELIATIIENDGYCAVETQDGRAAYRQLLSDSSFAVVILEMTLPHLKGLDIVRYMRTEKRLMKIPVVVISGGNQLRLMADSFAAGANAFLHKPFTAQQLETTLRMFLSQNQPHAIQKPASISA